MHHHTQLLALTAALLTRTSATPVPAPSSVVNCADVTAGLDPSCWAKLNMTDWIQNWASTSNVDSQVSIETPSDDGIHEPATNVTTGDFTGEGFRKRAPVPSAVVQASPATSTGAAAGCKAQELWSTCFLRLGLGVTGGDCTQIASKTCTAPKVASPPPTAQIYYGMWNIYGKYPQFPTLRCNIFADITPSNQSISHNVVANHPNPLRILNRPSRSNNRRHKTRWYRNLH